MKRLCALLAFLPAILAFSQPADYPAVDNEGRVTFRLKATNASVVKVECESLKAADMQKDEKGVWTFTTPPLEPDFYGYSFTVDGARVIDPINPLMKYNWLGSVSEVHVPGAKSLPWEVNDVAHGVVHRHFYRSVAAGDDRAYYVYTPPGYKPTAWKRYPVLYLLHGFSDEASAWWSVGRANIILDNLIARGEAKPMIVVMPLGYGTLGYLQREEARRRDPALRRRNMEQFRSALLDEVIPQVQSNYRASTRRTDRAIAGLSMGGGESLTVGLNALDRFAWIGAFSSGVNTNYAATLPKLDAAANDRLRLLWISCGKDDPGVKENRELVAWLKAKGVRLTWTEVPGVHSWRVWRRNLADFAPLLFKP